MQSRRRFLHQSSFLMGGSMMLSTSRIISPHQKIAPSDQLRIGVIGMNGMGWADTLSALKIPGVVLAAVCDVDENVIQKRLADLQKSGRNVDGIKRYADYRHLLDDKDVDAVIVGTPDHWHALIMIHACQAGKDVYVEKPAGNSIGECQAMIEAQKRYNRVVQVGQWQRSQKHFQDAVDFVHSGQLGNIRTVKVWCYQGWMSPQPVVPDSVPPPGVNYNAWLGPAPQKPFNSSRFHFHFRWFWDYAGGLMTDWGVHLLDYGLLGMKAAYPKTVVALGGRFAYPDKAQETPDTLTALYEFDHFNLVWDHAMGIDNGSYERNHGIAFIGNNGTLVVDRGGWEVIEEKQSKSKVALPHTKPSDNGLDKHWENFISVVKSRKTADLRCPIEDGGHVATIAQLGNISFRSGERVAWLPDKMAFTNAALTRKYLLKPYYNGYTLPKL